MLCNIWKKGLLFSGVLLLPLTCMANEPAPQILFDQSHNQQFLIEGSGELQLSKLAAIFRAEGAKVTSTTSPLSDDTLQGSDAVVISGPFTELKASEIDAVLRFLERGGRVAVMLHIGPPLSALLNRLDVEHSNTVLHERQNVIDRDLNFHVQDLTATPLFHGIRRFATYGAWALNPGSGSTAIARTSDQSWVDLNGDKLLSDGDAVGPFALAVSGTHGAGRFIVFGDDAIFQNRYLDDSNSKLAANLGSWLARLDN